MPKKNKYHQNVEEKSSEEARLLSTVKAEKLNNYTTYFGYGLGTLFCMGGFFGLEGCLEGWRIIPFSFGLGMTAYAGAKIYFFHYQERLESYMKQQAEQKTMPKSIHSRTIIKKPEIPRPRRALFKQMQSQGRLRPVQPQCMTDAHNDLPEITEEKQVAKKKSSPIKNNKSKQRPHPIKKQLLPKNPTGKSDKNRDTTTGLFAILGDKWVSLPEAALSSYSPSTKKREDDKKDPETVTFSEPKLLPNPLISIISLDTERETEKTDLSAGGKKSEKIGNDKKLEKKSSSQLELIKVMKEKTQSSEELVKKLQKDNEKLEQDNKKLESYIQVLWRERNGWIDRLSRLTHHLFMITRVSPFVTESLPNNNSNGATYSVEQRKYN